VYVAEQAEPVGRRAALKVIKLVKTIRENVTIDWTAKESVQAKLRVMVKRVLRKYGYPPDKQEKATQTVLQQAELIGSPWVARGQYPSAPIHLPMHLAHPAAGIRFWLSFKRLS
jgi:hypothetical protein